MSDVCEMSVREMLNVSYKAQRACINAIHYLDMFHFVTVVWCDGTPPEQAATAAPFRLVSWAVELDWRGWGSCIRGGS